jgi:hypothetical protein
MTALRASTSPPQLLFELVLVCKGAIMIKCHREGYEEFIEDLIELEMIRLR